MDWTASTFTPEGPRLVAGRPVEEDDGDGADRVYRGGCWFSPPRFARLCYRAHVAPGRQDYFSFRICRSVR